MRVRGLKLRCQLSILLTWWIYRTQQCILPFLAALVCYYFGFSASLQTLDSAAKAPACGLGSPWPHPHSPFPHVGKCHCYSPALEGPPAAPPAPASDWSPLWGFLPVSLPSNLQSDGREDQITFNRQQEHRRTKHLQHNVTARQRTETN